MHAGRAPFSRSARRPTSAEDWATLEFEIDALFDGAPVDEEQLFAGRVEEITKMIRTVMECGKHVVLFGDRGVGKTSLSNIFWKKFNKSMRNFIVARVQAGPVDSFTSLWVRALEELQAYGADKDEGIAEIYYAYDYLTPSQVRRELQRASPNSLPVIIIDEYNEVTDDDTKRLTAHLIKELHDFTISTTVIIVGVAENISTLIRDHQSIERAIIQIHLVRMTVHEPREIIQTRANITIIRFEEDTIWTIIVLSRGLPYFTQTLSKHAAKSAIWDRRLVVSNQDVDVAMTQFINDSEVSFRDSYSAATRSNQENYFQQSLLACALARTNDDGFFSAADVTESYSAIMGGQKRIAHFEKHLRRFSGDEGGNILICRGRERRQLFQFSDPMMQSYVIIRGIQSKMIDENAKKLLLQKTQGGLFPT